jgi:hypothetical protein
MTCSWRVAACQGTLARWEGARYACVSCGRLWGQSGGGQGRGELAGGEGVEGAEAAGEFGGGQAALAIQQAEKIVGAALAFLRVAFQAAGDEVAVGIAPRLGAWEDVVETLHLRSEQAQTIEATAGLASMDGLAQGLGAQEVLRFEVDNESGRGAPALDVFGVVSQNEFQGMIGENLFGQADFDNLTRFAACDRAQSAVVGKPAHGRASRTGGEAGTACQRCNGKADFQLSFQAAMPEKMRIDRAVDRPKAQTRHE